MHSKIVFCIPAFVLFVSCASVQERPEWIGGRSTKYPAELYLVGVGEGNNRDAAEKQARSEIGKIFKVDLKAVTSTLRSESIERKNDSRSIDSKEAISVNIDEIVTKTLEGTIVAEVWNEPKTGSLYALAVLDRGKTAAILEDRISEIDRWVVRSKELIKNSSDKLNQLRSLISIKSLLRTREPLNSDLKIVRPSGAGLEPPYSQANELAEVDDFLKNRMVIGVHGEGENVGQLVQTCIDSFTSKGLSVRKVGEQSDNAVDLVIGIKVNLDAPNTPVNGWYYCNWDVQLNGVSRASKSVFASESANGRAGQLSAAQARIKASFDAEKAFRALVLSLYGKLVGE